MTLIALEKLHTDPRNANVCPPEIIEKLKRHMERSHFCPALVVRPHPQQEGHFIIVDGHHRKLVVESLGWDTVECQIQQMDEQQAGVLLLTLNQLRGTAVPRKRAELIESLLPTFDLKDLALMLPETTGEIEGLLALLKFDQEALEKEFLAHLEAEKRLLPVSFGFMVPFEDAPLVEEAINVYKAQTKTDQGQALVAICRDALALNQEEKTNEK
jgi:ParB-like chromosome segregation protein Spo0J